MPKKDDDGWVCVGLFGGARTWVRVSDVYRFVWTPGSETTTVVLTNGEILQATGTGLDMAMLLGFSS